MLTNLMDFYPNVFMFGVKVGLSKDELVVVVYIVQLSLFFLFYRLVLKHLVLEDLVQQ